MSQRFCQSLPGMEFNYQPQVLHLNALSTYFKLAARSRTGSRIFSKILNISNVSNLQLVHERLLTPGSRSLWRAAPHVSADGDAQPLLFSQYCQVQLKY